MDALKALHANLPTGATLPNQRFFVPNNKFLAWIASYAKNRRIYDVGAGIGHVSLALSKLGLAVTALDLHYREHPHFDVEIANGCIYPYDQGSIVMLCRPCHNGMAEMVFHEAFYRGATPLLVGYKNRGDLGSYKAVTLLRFAGKERESVYEIIETR